jgi:hypothetical protein
MKEYSHGVLIERRVQRRRGGIEKRARAIVIIVIFVSMIVIGATTVSISSPRDQQGTQGSHISWTNDVVDSYGDVGQYCSLAMDPDGSSLEISYYNASTGDLKIATGGGPWNSNTMYSPGDVGLYTSQLRNNSVSHICFYNATGADLVYGTSSPGTGEVVDSYGDVGQYASLALNPATGTRAISYYNATGGDLKVAVNASGSGWINTTVDSVGDVGLYTSLVFMGTNDSISVIYYDATNHALKNAWQWVSAGPWGNMTIDSDPPLGDLGKWPSQYMSGSDWWGSYYDQTNGNLKVQYWLNGGASQGTTVPDSVGDVGQYTSIGVNSTGHVFISYYDVTNGDLKLAWNVTTTTWLNMTLDSVGDIGKFTSMKIDTFDRIHIAYYDQTNGDLKYTMVLASETPIPEFGDILIPVVGAIAVMAVLSVRRKQKEQ